MPLLQRMGFVMVNFLAFALQKASAITSAPPKCRRVVCVWIAACLLAHGAQADAGRAPLLIGDRLESYVETNYALADDPVREVTVDAEDGVITISITHSLDEKACDAKQRVKVARVADVRALDLDRARRSLISGVYLPFRPNVARDLETVKSASEALIARARARHGWGEAAPEEASELLAERYGDTLRLSHIADFNCDGSRDVWIDNPREWYVPLVPRADTNAFISLIREYQASLIPL